MKCIYKRLLAAILLMNLLASLCSCSLLAPKPETDLEDAKAALESAGYTVYIWDYEDSEDVQDKGKVRELIAYSAGYEDYINIICYEEMATAKVAKKLWNKNLDAEVKYYKAERSYHEHILDKYGDKMTSEEYNRIRSYIEEDEARADNAVIVGRSGKIVWSGTKNAIKDTQ